jgi:hypothetical protein
LNRENIIVKTKVQRIAFTRNSWDVLVKVNNPNEKEAFRG